MMTTFDFKKSKHFNNTKIFSFNIDQKNADFFFLEIPFFGNIFVTFYVVYHIKHNYIIL